MDRREFLVGASALTLLPNVALADKPNSIFVSAIKFAEKTLEQPSPLKFLMQQETQAVGQLELKDNECVVVCVFNGNPDLGNTWTYLRNNKFDLAAIKFKLDERTYEVFTMDPLSENA
jgi:hypothetical protein